MLPMSNSDTQQIGIEKLYEAYQRPLLAHLTRLVRDRATAEDLCQETFMGQGVKPRSFSPGI